MRDWTPSGQNGLRALNGPSGLRALGDLTPRAPRLRQSLETSSDRAKITTGPIPVESGAAIVVRALRARRGLIATHGRRNDPTTIKSPSR
jgi:hypothetical protein